MMNRDMEQRFVFPAFSWRDFVSSLLVRFFSQRCVKQNTLYIRYVYNASRHIYKTRSYNITITILDIHRPAFYLRTRRFEDWIMSPSSGGTYSGGLIRHT
jgi:hypothetical protein